MVLPLIATGIAGVLIKELPSIASWIFGDSTGKAVETVTGIARDVLGTDNPQAIEGAIARDPALALQFKTAVLQAEGQARQQALDEFAAQLHDVQSAREQTMRLAETKSPIAWGAPIVTAVVLITYGVMMALLFTSSIPHDQKEVAYMMLSSLATLAGVAVQYWLGSSRGSAMKDAAIAKLGRSAASP